MMRPTVLLKRSLIFIHRWMGVGLSVIFMLWFVSGIVMMYWSFPGVSAEDRLERAPVLDPAQIRFTPEEAYAKLNRDQPPGSALSAEFTVAATPSRKHEIRRAGDFFFTKLPSPDLLASC